VTTRLTRRSPYHGIIPIGHPSHDIEGIILIALGAAAIIVPPVATLAVTIFLGWLLLLSGIVGLLTTLWMRGVLGFWWSLFSAVLAIVVGVMLIGWPVRGAFSLTSC
jgi:uncharacterized membrane protein HdeD (DUF308 family)